MKTVLLAPTPPPYGGIAGWTVRMMNAKLKNGWKLALVDEKIIGNREVFGGKSESKRKFIDEAKRCYTIWSNLKIELKDEQAQIVHSCIPSATLSMVREYVCACITKKANRSFIIHFRCTVPNTTKGKFGNFFLKKLCNKSDLIITLNSQTNEYLEKVTKTPYVLIPNFISENEIEELHEIKEEIKTVLYVGGVIETKGAYDFIAVAEQFPDIQFRMVGNADTAVEEYVKIKMLKNVTMTGGKNKTEVRKELRNADVFMFLTYFEGEGFSNALCEAMAAGLPCIATDWAANADMLGKNGGFIVPVRDPNAAANALINMMPYEIRKRQSKSNISKVQDKYIDSVVIDQYVDVYESLMR